MYFSDAPEDRHHVVSDESGLISLVATAGADAKALTFHLQPAGGLHSSGASSTVINLRSSGRTAPGTRQAKSRFARVPLCLLSRIASRRCRTRNSSLAVTRPDQTRWSRHNATRCGGGLSRASSPEGAYVRLHAIWRAISLWRTVVRRDVLGPAVQSTFAVGSDIWCGATVFNDNPQYTAIHAQWRCPIAVVRPTSPALSEVAVWVGMKNPQKLFQAGTNTVCLNMFGWAIVSAYGWLEGFPDLAFEVLDVAPNDSVRVDQFVADSSGNTWFDDDRNTDMWFMITNLSQRTSYGAAYRTSPRCRTTVQRTNTSRRIPWRLSWNGRHRDEPLPLANFIAETMEDCVYYEYQERAHLTLCPGRLMAGSSSISTWSRRPERNLHRSLRRAIRVLRRSWSSGAAARTDSGPFKWLHNVPSGDFLAAAGSSITSWSPDRRLPTHRLRRA